jgi:ABC-type lipoprotein release transport system permease subunit
LARSEHSPSPELDWIDEATRSNSRLVLSLSCYVSNVIAASSSSYMPARRASNVDPILVLRSD